MSPVLSGFRKNKRSQRSATYIAAAAWGIVRNVLSLRIATLPSIRRKGPLTARPQTYLKRDVHKKNLGSPYAKEPIWHRIYETVCVSYRFGIECSLLLLVSSVWFFIVFLQPTFYIDRITIHGQEEIAAEEIAALVRDHLAQKSALVFPRSHRLFLGLNTLRESILDSYHLESLVFVPDWTAHVIEVHVREKPSLFLYSVDNRYFALDREGIVIREMPADTDPTKFVTPVLYEYDASTPPDIGTTMLSPQFITSVQRLSEGFTNNPQVQIHSFRLRISPQREVVITDQPPVTDDAKEEERQQADREFSQAAESIAQAQTIDEKVKQLKEALENLSVERLEEGKLDQLLKEQRVYSPTQGFAYKELEIYTEQGWSIKVGNDVFIDALAADEVLAIFATLEQQLNLQEVREYIDLRIPNRVYYR